jgi:NADH:ubiquinone oxidoreductase subunit F (NADH-binding)/NADH:ubiquinone oxidoreductase subunit E
MQDLAGAAPELRIEDLKEIQDQYGYLPADQMVALHKRTGIPLWHIHGVASFYPLFHLSPPPKANVKVCCDMSCHLHPKGGDILRDGLKQRFAAMSEKDVKVDYVSCLGQCDKAPAISINDHIYNSVTQAQTEALVLQALGGGEMPETPWDNTGPELASDVYKGGQKYGALRKLVETKDFDGVIKQLMDANLRGLGGAGFPAGRKWDTVRKCVSDVKYVVCNADESEPGTIKDRVILQRLPHLVAEGMIIAGLVTGAKTGILYIRHEYGGPEEVFKEEIERCKEEGLVGKNILGSDLEFELEIFVSPGGYIQGEESALLEAIEGKRGEPRNKPPFPVFEGLRHKPTALNNVETFSHAAQILQMGAAWYKAQGRNGCSGLKFVGVSGDVVHPGVFEVPMGTLLSEVIYQNAGGAPRGKRVKGVAPSGPSSGYISASMMDVPLDFDALDKIGTMLGSGAIVVCAEGRCMLDMALNSVRFFRNESCGKCVPCRMGTQKLTDLMIGWTQGKGKASDLKLLEELTEAMKLASICGLGQFAHMPITSVYRNFREEVEAHVLQRLCPEGVCPMREERL